MEVGLVGFIKTQSCYGHKKLLNKWCQLINAYDIIYTIPKLIINPKFLIDTFK